jgi:hypothetical protein
MARQVTKGRIIGVAASALSAAGDLAAKFLPRLARRGGVVTAFLDGKSAAVAVIRPVNRHSRVETSASIALEEEALANPEATGQALMMALEGLKRPPRTLVVAVGAELTFERKIALPAMSVEETDAAVEFQADRVLPFAASEMRFDYAVESAGADGVQSIVVSAITDETSAKIEAMSKAAGLTLAAVYAAPSAVYAAMAASTAAAGGGPKAVIYRRAAGVEMAVGTAGAPAMSRFVERASEADVAPELMRTASAAGIDLAGGATVFAQRELVDGLSAANRALEARSLETALEEWAGAAGEGPGAAAAIAAGTVFVRGVSIPNFYAPSAQEHRKERTSAMHGRTAKYVAAGLAAAAVIVLAVTGYWVYALVLESKARALAGPNADLKAAMARLEVARPWTEGRSILLEVLGGVTEVFPDSPAAFVKSLSVAESGKASVQGKVDNAKAAYDLVAALSKVKGFQGVKLDSGAADQAGGYSFAISFEVDSWRARK